MNRLRKYYMPRRLLENKKNKRKETLYLSYIKTLLKIEDLQNKLERMYSRLMDSPKSSSCKKTEGLNDSLNNLLVEVMVMQNAINLIDATNG